MYHQFELLLGICRRVGQQGCKHTLGEVPLFQFLNSCYSSSISFPSNLVKVRAFHLEEDSVVKCRQTEDSKEQTMYINKTASSVQNLLEEFSNSSKEMLFQALNNIGLSLSDDLVLEVLRRLHSDWKLAFQFFNWVSNDPSGFSPGSRAFNEMLGILGKAKQFEELYNFFSEMSLRGVVNERSYGIMVHRYAAAHRADDAIEFFYKRRQHGLELDLIAFQTLLLSLCRYKHVEAAEYLFLSKRSEFRYDTKTWNIILNGWCVLRNLRETKRFWNEMIRSKCKPDKITYGIFINALCKSGKISTAVKLFHAMWEKGCTPDVVICNSIIDGLCFKKRIPEAIGILREMNEKDCEPDVVTYNCLIKHLCKIGRMEIVHQLLDEMEMKGQNFSLNSRTYIHLLTTTKRPEEVQGLLERMKSNGCKMTGDLYNLLLKLYMNWDCEELVQSTWAEMSKDGFGPGQPSYTIMVHGLYEQGRIEDAFAYFEEMTSKGMVPEPRTKILVDAMKIKMDAKRAERTGNARFSGHAHKRGKAKVSGLPHQNAMKFYTTLSNDPDTHDDFKPTSKLESSDLSVKDIVEQDVKENSIMIYMKGVPEMPRCGFSSLAVRVLKEYGVPFSSRNILEDMELKNAVKAFSHWPTFPQIFIRGEFIGGSDIILNMHQTGELEQKLKDLSSQKKAE